MRLFLFIILLSALSLDSFSQFDLEKTFNTSISDEEREQVKLSIYNYSQEIKVAPDNPHNYLNRGVCYAKLGLYPDAISDYNRALRIDSVLPEAYYNRGIARARFRYTKTACMDIKHAYELGLEDAKGTYENNCGLFKRYLGELKD